MAIGKSQNQRWRSQASSKSGKTNLFHEPLQIVSPAYLGYSWHWGTHTALGPNDRLWIWWPEEPTGKILLVKKLQVKWKEKEVSGKVRLQGQELWRSSWNKVEEGSTSVAIVKWGRTWLHRWLLPRDISQWHSESVTRSYPTEESKSSPLLPLRKGGKAEGKGMAPLQYSQSCSKPRPWPDFCRVLRED